MFAEKSHTAAKGQKACSITKIRKIRVDTLASVHRAIQMYVLYSNLLCIYTYRIYWCIIKTRYLEKIK
jgi:hypothetical protein